MRVTQMLEVLGFFTGPFAVSAMFARSAPWKVAQYRFMLLEMSKWDGYRPDVYDPDRIQKQVKGRTLTKGWLVATTIGSALIGAFAFLMPTSPGIAIYLMLAGVAIIATYIGWRSVVLFNVAVAELGIKWPPYDADACPVGEARFDTRNPE